MNGWCRGRTQWIWRAYWELPHCEEVAASFVLSHFPDNCIFYTLKVCDNPVSGKSINAIFKSPCTLTVFVPHCSNSQDSSNLHQQKLWRPGWSLVIFRNKLCMVRPLRMTVFLLSVHSLPHSTPYAHDWLFSALVPVPRFDLFCQRGGEGRVPLLVSMITNGPNWSHP